ncbi:inositol monophosphatase, partial [Alcanivorax sp. HI0035]
DHSILAEESGEIRGKGDGADFQWVIDPLDGTTNFIHGFPQYCVSIALKYKGKLEHAVIYDPNRDEEFTASRGRGAALNGRRIRCTNRPGLEGCLIGTGFPFRKDQAPHMDAYLGMFADIAASTAGLRRPGSAALDLAWLAAGRLDGFFEFGLSEWDLAAGALLITEAGGLVGDLSGGHKFLESG